MSEFDEVMEHFGVKGMHWGARRADRVNATASDDARAAGNALAKVKKSGVHTLSNKELQSMVTRMNLEQQFDRLKSPPKGKQAAKFVADILLSVGKQEATKFIAGQAAKQVAKTLAGVG